MRRYWDSRAATNAAFYVDTSLSYDDPDMAAFLETGRVVVREAIDDAPVEEIGTGSAVEIGCGLGRVCLALAERFDEVVGVDISREMLDRAEQLVRDPKVRFVHGDGASLAGVADGSADLVLTFTVFQHIPDPSVIAAYVGEAARVLRPGGVFVAQWNATPRPWRWNIRRMLLSAAQRTGVRRERFGRNDPAFLGSRVPWPRMQRMIEDAGLAVAGRRGDGLWTWVWAHRP